VAWSHRPGRHSRRPRQTATELRVIGLGYEVVSRTA